MLDSLGMENDLQNRFCYVGMNRNGHSNEMKQMDLARTGKVNDFCFSCSFVFRRLGTESSLAQIINKNFSKLCLDLSLVK